MTSPVFENIRINRNYGRYNLLSNDKEWQVSVSFNYNNTSIFINVVVSKETFEESILSDESSYPSYVIEEIVERRKRTRVRPMDEGMLDIVNDVVKHRKSFDLTWLSQKFNILKAPSIH